MPEIEIRPAIASDIPALMAIDPTYTSDFVWQMEISVEDSQVSVSFREIRLPRSVRVEYPRSVQSLAEGWTERHGLLVALLQGEPVGYVSLMLNIAPHTAWVTDLAVVRRLRRQEESETPEEVLESAYGRMKAGLVSEVLARVKAASPEFFERLVVELLLKMGYGGSRKDAGQAIGKAGDEGIDGVISEDRLGLDSVYLQAKKWETSVGRPDIQKLVGALQGKRARKGVFITTASFSSEAISYVDRIDPKVVLIDGRRLAELMIDFEVGVATARTYSVKRLDSDYFDEG